MSPIPGLKLIQWSSQCLNLSKLNQLLVFLGGPPKSCFSSWFPWKTTKHGVPTPKRHAHAHPHTRLLRNVRCGNVGDFPRASGEFLEGAPNGMAWPHSPPSERPGEVVSRAWSAYTVKPSPDFYGEERLGQQRAQLRESRWHDPKGPSVAECTKPTWEIQLLTRLQHRTFPFRPICPIGPQQERSGRNLLEKAFCFGSRHLCED